MPYKPPTIEKIYYSIGEVAALFQVNPSLIRFWEKEFDVLQPHKNKKGNRMFTVSEIENLRIIYHLVKERGFTLEGARNQLKENRDEALRFAQISHSLENIREYLLEIDTVLANRQSEDREREAGGGKREAGRSSVGGTL
jgi:DNA-binding transcriptional MerR regulator